MLNTQDQNANSPFLSPYISYRSSGKKLLTYQENSSWVIIPSILMTSDGLSIDITRRNLMLITIGAYRGT